MLPPVFRKATPRKIWIENMILAAALPWVAGAVNASGFFLVGSYTSHVSGHLARAGDELAQGRRDVAYGELIIVGVFLAGAITATALVEAARRKAKARYAAALFLEALVLTAFTVASVGLGPGVAGVVLTCLLSFSMGLQNALVTRMSGAVVRTTHMTGVVTDMGIELHRGFLWLKDHLRERERRGGASLLTLLRKDPELKRLRLHAIILSSFLSGAVLGPVSYLKLGGVAMLVPVLVLLCLVAFDALYGLGAGQVRDAERPSSEHLAVSATTTPLPPPERLVSSHPPEH